MCAGESYVVFGSDAPFAASLDLAALDGANGFVINGIDEGDSSGSSVSGAGDVNGDGFDDLIIGASGADPDGKADAGESYVVFGSDAPFAASLDLAALDGANGFVINGIDEGDNSGWSVSGAGDVNGDGFDDLIIGTCRPYGKHAGESYVVFGQEAFPDSDLISVVAHGRPAYGAYPEMHVLVDGALVGTAVVTAEAVAYDFEVAGLDAASTLEVRFANDAYDGDSGIDRNLYVEAVTKTVDGVAEPMPVGLATYARDDGNTMPGQNKLYWQGELVFDLTPPEPIPDPDLISVVAHGRPAYGAYPEMQVLVDGALVGAAVVTAEAVAYDFEVAGLDAASTLEVRFANDAYDGDSGIDRNLYVEAVTKTVDGVAEPMPVGLATYVRDDGNTMPGQGKLYWQGELVFDLTPPQPIPDPDLITLSELNGANGFVINGIDYWHGSGRSVGGAGDVNGDGFDDLIIGAPWAYSRGVGASHVVFGSDAPFAASFELAALDGANGFEILGQRMDGGAGTSVSGAGDVNGDGFDDLIIGAPYGRDPADLKSLAGESYVVFGSGGPVRRSPPSCGSRRHERLRHQRHR